MTSYKTHLFICTNAPDNPNKCGGKSAEEMRKKLKEKCRVEFGSEVRINSAGCLGQCEMGIAAVIYPQGEWHLQLSAQDGDVLLERVRELQKKNQNRSGS